MKKLFAILLSSLICASASFAQMITQQLVHIPGTNYLYIASGADKTFVKRTDKITFNGESKALGSNPTFVQEQADWNEKNKNKYSFIKNKPTKISEFNDDVGIVSTNWIQSNYYDIATSDNRFINTNELGNGTLSIKTNGTEVGSFNANSFDNVDVDIPIGTAQIDIKKNDSVVGSFGLNDFQNQSITIPVGDKDLILKISGEEITKFNADDTSEKSFDVTIEALDVDNTVANYISETYGLTMTEDNGVTLLSGFDNSLSFENNNFEFTTNFVITSSEGTINFVTPTVPQHNGNDLATQAWTINYIAGQNFIPYAEDDNNEYTALTIGSRTEDNVVGPNSVSFGENNEASGVNSIAEGVYAIASDDTSYVWNGNADIEDYSSHGEGTYSINPINGIDNFWIGNVTLGQLITAAANAGVLSLNNKTNHIIITNANESISIDTETDESTGISTIKIASINTNSITFNNVKVAQNSNPEFEQVQADWNATEGYSLIQNKPTFIGDNKYIDVSLVENSNPKQYKTSYSGLTSVYTTNVVEDDDQSIVETNKLVGDVQLIAGENIELLVDNDTLTINNTFKDVGVAAVNNFNGVISITNDNESVIIVDTIDTEDNPKTIRIGANLDDYATKHWVNQFEHELVEKQSFVIDSINDENELWFKYTDENNITNTIVFPEANEDESGRIIVWVEETPSESNYYDFDLVNLDAFKNISEKPWLTSTNDSNWRFEFVSVPRESGWRCDSFKEYVKPLPTKAYYSDGTIKKYNIKKIDESSINKTNLINVESGENLSSIEERAFINCSTITNVVISDSITNIGQQAFWGCTNLETLDISENIPNLTIDAGAFYRCTKLKTIKIPANVNLIITNKSYCTPFQECFGVEEFIVDPDNPNIKSENGLLLSKDGKILINGLYDDFIIPDGVETILFNSCQGNFKQDEVQHITIPNSVTEIGDNAFRWSRITNIVLPNNLKTIGNGAFSGCKLKNIEIPGTITSFGNFVFNSCLSLTNAIVGNGITQLPNQTFDQCGNLYSITLPYSLNSLGRNYVFGDCTNLRIVYYYNPNTESRLRSLLNGKVNLNRITFINLSE